MSVPRRILARPVLPALRAATAQYSAAVARPSWRAAAAPAPVAVAAAPRALRWYSVKTPEPKSYTFEEVTEQIRTNDEIANGGKGDKVIFVDVREPHELLDTGRIPGAINVPIDSAPQSFHVSEEDFYDAFGYDRPPQDAHLLFYCKAGVRAKTALALAQHAGWKNVSDYPGSWLDWARNNGEREVRNDKNPSQWDRLTGKN